MRELRDVTIVSRQFRQSKTQPPDSVRRPDGDGEKLPDLTLENAERALYMLENDEHLVHGGQRGEDGFDLDAGGEIRHFLDR